MEAINDLLLVNHKQQMRLVHANMHTALIAHVHPFQNHLLAIPIVFLWLKACILVPLMVGCTLIG